jgi:predicted flap endonuclease-1-like 5' DNA nuclease
MTADPIKSLKGITDALAGKLKDHGIDNTDQLVAAALDYSAREKLAGTLGIATAQLTELVNRADLARISGIAGVYADLLENAGVDSVKELSHRVPANLHAKLEEVNGKLKLTTRPPTLSAVEGWVAEAKKLA